MTSGKNTERVGNRGYSGSPTADTYQCTDGWLSTAANTPVQFRKLAAKLGLDAVCADGRALDLEAFNAPNGGFVVARDLPYLREKFAAAFAGRSAVQMEAELNAAGVPAARVRTLKEFLDEAPGRVTFPAFDIPGDGRSPGLGFALRHEGDAEPRGAPALGADNERYL
jgi:crotonobetainyl-CoA:carnitine CoA-transferase CaiB-like acyl-CoA transferase